MVKRKTKTDVLAGHLNMLDMYGWYSDLIDEYEELFVYFLNKIKRRGATVDVVFRRPLRQPGY